MRSARCKHLWAALALGVASCDSSGGSRPAVSTTDPPDDEQQGRPSFVVILSDDQPFHTLWAMPEVDALAAQGVRFTRAFSTVPICSPARASFLSGGFHARETGVMWNSAPNGGAQVFREDSTLGTRLQAAGYRTGYVGKWMNQSIDGHVPPGWDRYVSRNYKDGVQRPWGEYRLYTYRDYAIEFLEEAVGADEPFLLILSSLLPHYPSIPAPGDEHLYPTYTYRDRGFGEEDLSDKPPVVHIASGQFSQPTWTREEQDESQRNQLRSLAAVDRTIADLIDTLAVLGVDEETYVFFWSDHGLQWGEHGLVEKDWAYEESIRVPFVAWGPGVQPAERTELVDAPLDIAATILALSKAAGDTDGRSLLPLLRDEKPRPAWREHIFLEFVTSPFVWAAVRTQRWKYVEWGEGHVELYDLETDPYELESLHDDPASASVLADLRRIRVGEPRALAFREPRYRLIPVGAKVGEPYAYDLQVWGGRGALSFDLVKGTLPPGLHLRADGRISGIPTQPVPPRENLFDVRVCDSHIRRHQEQPHCHVKTLDLAVKS